MCTGLQEKQRNAIKYSLIGGIDSVELPKMGDYSDM